MFKEKLEDAKRIISLVGYISSGGHKVKKVGASTFGVIPCPKCGKGNNHFRIHENGTEAPYYNSFNTSCCNGGSIIDYLIEIEGLSQGEACAKVIELAGVQQPRISKVKTVPKKDDDPKVVSDPDYTDIINVLHKNSDKTDYFIKRGLSQRIISAYKLGFHSQGLNYVIGQAVGLIESQNDYMKAYRLFLPVWDAEDRCRYFITRIDDNRTDMSKTHNLKGHTARLFNDRYLDKPFLIKNSQIWVVEGIFDALSLEELGHKAIALNSVSNTKILMKQLAEKASQLKNKVFIICPDNDEAGRKLEECVSQIQNLGLKALNYQLPKVYKDANEFLMQDREAFERHISDFIDISERQAEAEVVPTGEVIQLTWKDPEFKQGWKLGLEWKVLNKKANAEIIIPSRKNIMIILENDERLKGLIAKNSFINQTVLSKKPPWGRDIPGSFWGDTDDAELKLYMEINYGIESSTKIYDSTLIVAERNSFHPVKNYLSNLRWDGMPRIDSLLMHYLGAADTPYVRAVTRKTLIGAVARIFNPGCKFDTMLVLVGPQGIYKSTFFRLLCGNKWFTDGLKFGDMDKKTGSEKCEGYWFLEIGELAGLRKMEVESVKSFLSCQTDIFRPAYGRRKVANPRQCIIVGSTNNELGFLRDPTGARRFWPITVRKGDNNKDILTDFMGHIRDQIWAEAVCAFKSNETYHLDSEMEIEAARIQEEHTEDNPLVGQIEEFLKGKDKACAALVWTEMLLEEKSKLNPQRAKEINEIINKIPGWQSYDLGTKKLSFGSLGFQRAFVRKT